MHMHTLMTGLTGLLDSVLFVQAAAAATSPEGWWSVRQGTLIGAFGGAGVGLLGATLGPAMGILVPKGKGKSIILPALLTIGVLGVALLVSGLVALISKQPYHVWYPLVLIGLISSVVMLPLFFVAKGRYRAAERNRMEAQDLLRH
jgi:hypothetical protein